ncbi:hypothetical protein [Halapricum salinum]|nr:hypothetical protein [Halapricum salinum]
MDEETVAPVAATGDVFEVASHSGGQSIDHQRASATGNGAV